MPNLPYFLPAKFSHYYYDQVFSALKLHLGTVCHHFIQSNPGKEIDKFSLFQAWLCVGSMLSHNAVNLSLHFKTCSYGVDPIYLILPLWLLWMLVLMVITVFVIASHNQPKNDTVAKVQEKQKMVHRNSLLSQSTFIKDDTMRVQSNYRPWLYVLAKITSSKVISCSPGDSSKSYLYINWGGFTIVCFIFLCHSTRGFADCNTRFVTYVT